MKLKGLPLIVCVLLGTAALPGAPSSAQVNPNGAYLTGGLIQLDGTLNLPSIPCTNTNGCNRTGGSFTNGRASGTLSGVNSGTAFHVSFVDLRVSTGSLWHWYGENHAEWPLPAVNHCGFFGSTSTTGSTMSMKPSSVVTGAYGTQTVTAMSANIFIFNFNNVGTTTHIPFDPLNFTLTLSSGAQVTITPTSDLAGGFLSQFRGRGSWVEQGGFVPTVGATCGGVLHSDLHFDVSVPLKAPQVWLWPGI